MVDLSSDFIRRRNENLKTKQNKTKQKKEMIIIST